MDISRLPVAPLTRPVNATFRTTTGTASPEAAKPVESTGPARKGEERFEHVVQGELLQRERDPAHTQTTREFINERRFEHARDSEYGSAGGHQSRSAIALYLNNSRPEAVADLTQGRSVNYFV